MSINLSIGISGDEKEEGGFVHIISSEPLICGHTPVEVKNRFSLSHSLVFLSLSHFLSRFLILFTFLFKDGK